MSKKQNWQGIIRRMNYVLFNDPKIPAEFVALYFNENYIFKVYLFLLAANESELSEENLADISAALGISQDQVVQAITYLTEHHFIWISREPEAYEKLLLSFLEHERQQNVSLPEILYKWIVTKTSSDLLTAITRSDMIRIIAYAEKITERCLRTEELLLLLYLQMELKMAPDLIDYLFLFCKENRMLNMEQLLQHALFWSDQELHTVQQVKKMRTELKNCVSSVQEAFRLERRLHEEEYNYIIAWLTQLDFSVGMIASACEITYEQTKGPVFKYANTVLRNWEKSGIKTMQDIKLRYPQLKSKMRLFDNPLDVYENTTT